MSRLFLMKKDKGSILRGAIEGNPADGRTDDALMVDQGFGFVIDT
jgi:hypothetical protein